MYNVIVFDHEIDFFHGSKKFDSENEAFAFARAEKITYPEATVRVFTPSDDEVFVD